MAVAVAVLIGMWVLFTSKPTTPLAAPPTDALLLEILRLIFYAIAGIGGVVALTIAYRKQRLGEAAEAREDAKLFTEQFAAAADQLSSDQAANRLAGVYAMASLADDWNRGRQQCVNVLCAYLQLPYEPPTLPEDPTAEQQAAYKLTAQERQVRHTIVNIIGERLRFEPVRGKTWHWCTFDFERVTFDGGSLHGASFKGHVSFNQAQFPTGFIGFVGTEFPTGVGFFQAEFSGATVKFIDTKFAGEVCTFYSAKFTDGIISFRHAQITADLFNFSQANLSGGSLHFSPNGNLNGARFSEGSALFEGACFSGAVVDFQGAQFAGGIVDLREVADWSVPPNFDAFPNGVPAGLLLPGKATDAPAPPRSPS
ncbi:hypothetical protein LO763_22505 [Glycomyces sp. A-F 0318]|uniref:pentapeptide repeat-containing protein n=1 Tax=Glycomyces amatae TaxID=2881355 RepID=UPI001E32B984|nr:hypothetical protein [Glycomyces amatae]MCD0446391.1 hypothetical protein [Glycomyces amatae]